MNKLIVALDVSSLKEAEKLVKNISPSVEVFKVGKELFTAVGPQVVQMIHSYHAKVFLDLKFHDIPNTVGAACEAAARLGVFMLNVHCLGGKEMLMKAASAVKNISMIPPILLGVTILTSLKEADLEAVGIENDLKNEVKRLAQLAKTCGLNGVVASPQEIELIRKSTGPDFLIVTPGVRPSWAASGDQKRVLNPKEAVEKGADFIVVGRPITQNPDPLAAAKKILAEISQR